MSRKPWVLFAALVVAVLALAAAGCGGGDEESATPPGETGAPADTGGGAAGGGTAAADQTLHYALGSNVVLDPNLLQDTTSNKIAFAIFDPLVKLDENLQPEPAVAESWDVSEDGKTVTFHLRDDATWSNGDPVTAGDYEYSWKRILSPELAAPYSYQLYGIEGAIDYNSCDAAKDDCDALRDAVGVKAVDDQTLEVTLTSEQPWFVQQSTHSAFLPVPQATIEEFGDKWTDPGNIVTNGPFLLDDYQPDATLVMSKNPDWRDADSVTLEKFDGRIIVDGTTAVQAFEAGEVDSLDEQIPTEEIARLKTTDDYQQYPGLLTQAYGFNVKNVTDVNQRRAMSLAVDRQTIIDNITQADEVPATSWTPLGMPGFDVINPNSPWTPGDRRRRAGEAGARPGPEPEDEREHLRQRVAG